MVWLSLQPLAALQARMPSPDAWCTPLEAARSQAFLRPERQQRFWAGRWLLRELLTNARGPAPEVPLTVDAFGRAVDPCGWSLSLSHSGDWLCAAVSGSGPVGVDVEQPKARRDWQALAQHCDFEPCATAADFYRQWTLVEAWLKAQPPPQEAYGWKRWRWVADSQGRGWSWGSPNLHVAVYGALTPPQGLDWGGTPPLCFGGRWEARPKPAPAPG